MIKLIFSIEKRMKQGSSINLVDLVSSLAPQLLSNLEFTNFLYSDLPEYTKADSILATYYAKVYIEKNRKHNKDNVSPDIYSVYKKYVSTRVPLSRHQFQNIFGFLFSIQLNSNSMLYSNPKVYSAISSMKYQGISSTIIRQYLFSLINNSTSLPNIDSSLLSPEQNHLEVLDTLIQAKKSIMPIKRNIFDALSIIDTDEKNNDISLEISAIFPIFISTIEKGTGVPPQVIIINPSSALIRSINRYLPIENIQITFVVDDDLQSQVLNVSFNSNNLSAISYENLANTLLRNTPSSILFFAHSLNRNSQTEKKKSILKTLKGQKEAEICVFDVDNSFISDHTNNTYLINHTPTNVWLFPAGIINCSEPQRKTLIHFMPHISEITNNISISSYILKNENCEQYIEQIPFRASIDSKALFNNSQTYRSIFYSQHNKYLSKNTSTRNRANVYTYTPEINIHYTISGAGSQDSPCRLKAYVKSILEGSNTYQIAAGTEKSTKKSEEIDVINWLENDYLYDLKIHQTLSSLFCELLNGHSVTLKTLIYISFNWYNELPLSAKTHADRITNSSLAEISIDRINENDIYDYLNNFSSNDRVSLYLLSQLFEIGIKSNNCTNNPANEIYNLFRAENEPENLLRKNLVKKNFTEDEFRELYKKISNKSKNDPKALAVLICLLQGLDPNIVTALLLRDFVELTEFKMLSTPQYCLIIQRQKNNNGVVVPLRNKECYRTIPLCAPLSQMLISVKERFISENTGMPIDHILSQPLFDFTPQQLRKELRKYIQWLNIPAEYVSLPDNDGGTFESNLALYHGQLFTSSFKYYAKYYGKIDDNELNYILGLQQNTTFGNSYCDYSCDRAQLIIGAKMNRIISSVLMDSSFQPSMIAFTPSASSLRYSTDADNRSLTQIEIHMSIPANSQVEIEYSNTYGTITNIHNMEVKNGN